jgi:hypothetical protein
MDALFKNIPMEVIPILIVLLIVSGIIFIKKDFKITGWILLAIAGIIVATIFILFESLFSR